MDWCPELRVGKYSIEDEDHDHKLLINKVIRDYEDEYFTSPSADEIDRIISSLVKSHYLIPPSNEFIRPDFCRFSINRKKCCGNRVVEGTDRCKRHYRADIKITQRVAEERRKPQPIIPIEPRRYITDTTPVILPPPKKSIPRIPTKRKEVIELSKPDMVDDYNDLRRDYENLMVATDILEDDESDDSEDDIDDETVKFNIKLRPPRLSTLKGPKNPTVITTPKVEIPVILTTPKVDNYTEIKTPTVITPIISYDTKRVDSLKVLITSKVENITMSIEPKRTEITTVPITDNTTGIEDITTSKVEKITITNSPKVLTTPIISQDNRTENLKSLITSKYITDNISSDEMENIKSRSIKDNKDPENVKLMFNMLKSLVGNDIKALMKLIPKKDDET